MPRKNADGKAPGEGWSNLHPWLAVFLSEKTTPRNVLQWWGWAHARLREGWSAEEVKDRLREAWRLHSHGMDLRPLEDDLRQSLEEVYKAAEGGWTPAQCAVVYRSLYRVHPTRHWLDEWAARWEAAGDDWKAVVMP